MKKFISIFLTSFLILAFGAIVYAQQPAKFGGSPGLEFKATGWIDAQTLLFKNVTAGNPASGIYNNWGVANSFAGGQPVDPLDKTVSFWETRGRLTFNALMGKELSGTVTFEMDTSPWGNNDGTRNSLGFWTTDRAAVEIKHLFFDVGLPVVPVPITVRIGAQGFYQRANFFQNNDGMGITTSIKLDPATIKLVYAKAVEGQNWSADDVDVYGLDINAKVKNWTFGGYGFYYNMNNYPFYQVPQTMQAPMWWLGAYFDGKLGPVNLNFDFGYDYGKVENVVNAAVPDVDYRGWCAMLKIDFPFDKFNFGAMGAYATGADKEDTSASGLPGTLTSTGVASTKVKSFVVPPGTEVAPAFGEGMVFFSTFVDRGDHGINVNLNQGQINRGHLGGIWWAKLYASLKATPWYKVTLQGFYIGDTTKNGNTFGTAREGTNYSTLRDDSGIGWELDLINEIQIYKNLKFMVGGGYLWAGKAMDLYTNNTTAGNYSPDNPWAITTNITYNW